MGPAGSAQPSRADGLGSFLWGDVRPYWAQTHYDIVSFPGPFGPFLGRSGASAQIWVNREKKKRPTNRTKTSCVSL